MHSAVQECSLVDVCRLEVSLTYFSLFLASVLSLAL